MSSVVSCRLRWLVGSLAVDTICLRSPGDLVKGDQKKVVFVWRVQLKCGRISFFCQNCSFFCAYIALLHSRGFWESLHFFLNSWIYFYFFYFYFFCPPHLLRIPSDRISHCIRVVTTSCSQIPARLAIFCLLIKVVYWPRGLKFVYPAINLFFPEIIVKLNF